MTYVNLWTVNLLRSHESSFTLDISQSSVRSDLTGGIVPGDYVL